MSAKHTPGPWKTGGTFNPRSDTPTQWVWSPTPKGMQCGDVICQHASPANARLIAASPCLLEALQSLLFIHENVDETGYVTDVGFYPVEAELEKAKAAIAKATGE